MAKAGKKQAVRLLKILHQDREERLLEIDAMIQGDHPDPYIPDTATAEYRELAEKAKSNMLPLVVGTPAQAMYVDNFRVKTKKRGAKEKAKERGELSPAMKHFERSRLRARQGALYHGALGLGHAFTVTEKEKDGFAVSRGYSALRSAGLFEDAANDIAPAIFLTVTRFPEGDEPGIAKMWDDTWRYKVAFDSLGEPEEVAVTEDKRHDLGICPATRFACAVDLDARTVGVVEPIIPYQLRFNQAIFDLLVVQSGGAFKVRWATGMAPPYETEVEYEYDPDFPDDESKRVAVGMKLKVDPDTGQPIPKPINVNAKKFLFAEDPDAKFGTLDGTSLDGYIAAIEMSMNHLFAASQVPPHHFLGELANLSAEALIAAETTLTRMVSMLQTQFGESWERVFRVAALIDKEIESLSEEYQGEVIWRDMEQRSLAQVADSLGKLANSLGIPKRGLWERVPGVTDGELRHWEDLATEEGGHAALADAINALADQDIESKFRTAQEARYDEPSAAA